jgi:trigger factor
VESVVETRSPTCVQFAIEVPLDELEPDVIAAYRDIAIWVRSGAIRNCRIPFQTIDQRVGAIVLPRALEQAILTQVVAAVRDHGMRPLGRPEIDIVDFGDGRPLTFTAVAGIRPTITLPELSTIEVEVKTTAFTDTDVDDELDRLRHRFATRVGVDRPAASGDFVQIDLTAMVDGVEVDCGHTGSIWHRVGAGQLPAELDEDVVDGDELPSTLDEAILGRRVNETTTFRTQLVGDEFAHKDADVTITVNAVTEQRLPVLDDEFAALAGNVATLVELRGHLHDRLLCADRAEQLTIARDKALQAIVAAVAVAIPEAYIRDEAERRKQRMTDQLRRLGTSLAEHLAGGEKTEAGFDADLIRATVARIGVQLVLDTLAETEQIQITEQEYRDAIIDRARQAGVSPQAYYDQALHSGESNALLLDLGRDKALGLVAQRIVVKDSDGTILTP